MTHLKTFDYSKITIFMFRFIIHLDGVWWESGLFDCHCCKDFPNWILWCFFCKPKICVSVDLLCSLFSFIILFTESYALNILS